MTYTTLDQLTERFGAQVLLSLTDRGPVQTGIVDGDVVARALADTDAVIDGYLQSRYALPVTSVPTLLSDLAQSIAIYKLHVYQPDPKIEEDYKNAMRSLREIADGRIVLTIAGQAAAGTGGSGARITDRARPLTETNLKGFI